MLYGTCILLGEHSQRSAAEAAVRTSDVTTATMTAPPPIMSTSAALRQDPTAVSQHTDSRPPYCREQPHGLPHITANPTIIRPRRQSSAFHAAAASFDDVSNVIYKRRQQAKKGFEGRRLPRTYQRLSAFPVSPYMNIPAVCEE